METILTQIFLAYLECALFCGTEDNYQYISDNVDNTAKETMLKDCTEFYTEIKDLLPEDIDYKQIGHDFWLSRNRHGSGFWDRDEDVYSKELGQKLHEIAIAKGEVDLYIGDDNLLYHYPA